MKVVPKSIAITRSGPASLGVDENGRSTAVEALVADTDTSSGAGIAADMSVLEDAEYAAGGVLLMV